MTINMLGKALSSSNLSASVGTIKQAREHLEFEAELLGQLRACRTTGA